MSVSVGFAGARIVEPGAYTNIKPEIAAGQGLNGLGTVILIGEADEGAPFTAEDNLLNNSFSPAGFQSLVSKYRAGRIVDAARFGLAPSGDPRVPGGMQKIYVIKTNASTKSELALAANYGTLKALAYGKGGNQLNLTIATDQAEVKPTTGSFTYIPAASGSVVAYRINGGAEITQAVSADLAPDAFQALTWTGLTVTGGTDRNIIKTSSVGQDQLAVVSVSGQNATINLIQGGTGTGEFDELPQAGDTFRIPTGSVIAGTGNANVGWWLITSATISSINARKVTAGAPVAVAATTIAAATDCEAYEAVEIASGTATQDGSAATLEIYDGGGVVNINTILLQSTLFSGTTAPITSISTSGTPKLITSSAELKRLITINRMDTEETEENAVGGRVGMRIGYLGTTATMTINATQLTTTVTGGSGSNLTINLADYATINDLAAFIATQTGYSCAAPNTAIGLLPPSALDKVSALGICAEFSASIRPGRVKVDYYDVEQLFDASQLVSFEDGSGINKGLPANTAKTFFAGGSRGGTTAAQFASALEAAKKIPDAAFVVPLFSRDATEDILAGETESSSTYQIESINSSTQSHCVLMSGVKQRKERIAILSRQAAYADVKEQAFNLASNRSVLVFQQIKLPDSQGVLKWFQPWMFAAGIAGMQSGVPVPSRPVTFKTISVNGVRQLANDFDPIAQSEDAIDAGLVFIQEVPGVGFRVLLGNSTYLRSDGTAWYYSRLGVQYTADLLSKSLRSFLENNFIGLSNAELSAESVKNALVARLIDLKNQGILVGDDTNKGLGFKALVVRINGSEIRVDVNVTIAEGIEFALVNITASRVQQAA
jgi:hypothetical protein